MFLATVRSATIVLSTDRGFPDGRERKQQTSFPFVVTNFGCLSKSSLTFLLVSGLSATQILVQTISTNWKRDLTNPPVPLTCTLERTESLTMIRLAPYTRQGVGRIVPIDFDETEMTEGGI